jgi:hypothetical protein
LASPRAAARQLAVAEQARSAESGGDDLVVVGAVPTHIEATINVKPSIDDQDPGIGSDLGAQRGEQAARTGADDGQIESVAQAVGHRSP